MSWTPNRDRAYALLTQYTTKPGLIKHALAVEAAMRAMARHFGEDEDLWGELGLLHDFDYEQNPTEETHPYVGAEILRKNGYPEEFVNAVLGHAPYTGVKRDTLMARALFAVDELSGFVIACVLVRPDKSLSNLKFKSVKKRMKDKAFARAVSRDDIRLGAEELGMELEEVVNIVIEGLKTIAGDLGLNA